MYTLDLNDEKIELINSLKLRNLYDFGKKIGTNTNDSNDYLGNFIHSKFTSNEHVIVSSKIDNNFNELKDNNLKDQKNNTNSNNNKINNENRNLFNFDDRKNDLFFKLAKTIMMIYDFQVIKENFIFNNVDLICTCGSNKISLFFFNKDSNTYTEVIDISPFNEINITKPEENNELFYCFDTSIITDDFEFKLNDFKEKNKSFLSSYFSQKRETLIKYDEPIFEFFIIFSGENSVIRVVNIIIKLPESINNINSSDKNALLNNLDFRIVEYKNLIGHRNIVYSISVNPIYNELVLSTSHDTSIRLWNYILGVQLAIYGGKEGHSKMVICSDWHFLGKKFCTGGADRIKVWELEDEILNINSRLNDEMLENEYNREVGVSIHDLIIDENNEKIDSYCNEFINNCNHNDYENISRNQLLLHNKLKKSKNENEDENDKDDEDEKLNNKNSNNNNLILNNESTIIDDLLLSSDINEIYSNEKLKRIEYKSSSNIRRSNKVKLYPFPIYTIDIHCGYTDSIYYVGDSIISKSNNDMAQGEIFEWVPFKLQNCDLDKFLEKMCSSMDNNSGNENFTLNTYYLSHNIGSCFCLVNKYVFEKNDDLFLSKMTLNKKFNTILVGNSNGKICIFSKNEEFSIKEYSLDNSGWFYELKDIKPKMTTYLISGNIRKADLRNDGYLYAVNDLGTFICAILK